MKKYYFLLLTGISLSLVTFLGCKGKGYVDANGTISGVESNSSQTDIPIDLNIRHHDSGASKPARIRYDTAPNEVYADVSVQLEITEERDPPSFPETYHFLAISPVNQTFGPLITPDNENFIKKHIGLVMYFQLSQGNAAESETYEGNHIIHGGIDFNGRRIGAAWLARVEDNDKFVPWQIEEEGGDFPCFGDDCFDMETLLTDLFLDISGKISEKVNTIPLVSVMAHRLYYIPSLWHSVLVASNIVAPGFGLVYAARVQVPLQTATVLVPLTFYFRRADDGTFYSIYIDPLSSEVLVAGTSVPWQNLDRITVYSDAVLGLFAGTLINKVKEGLAEVSLPEFAEGDLSAEDALRFAIDIVTGGLPRKNDAGVIVEPIPQNFALLIIPEEPEEAESSNLIMWRNGLGADQSVKIGNPVRLQFLH